MKILIAANHYPVASGRYMADAFRRLGHEAKTVGYSTQNNIWGMKVEAKYAWYPDPTPEGDWPDLIIVMDTDSRVWNQVKHFQYHNKNNSPVVIYTVDNHVRDVEDELFDHYFLAHYHGPAYPVDLARADHSWLPCASDPMFTPSPIAWEDRGFDVCCVGVMYPRRLEVVEALKSAGLKVFTATGLLYEEYRAAYWNSRISLCVSAASDVAQRIFETGRMGCAILTDPLLDFADETTNKALGIYSRATYQNPQEAVLLARDLLGEASAYNIGVVQMQSQEPLGKGAALALQGYCKPHTWDARAQVIVDWFEREYGKAESVVNISGKGEYAIGSNGHTFPIGEVTEGGNLKVTDLPMMPDKRRRPFLNLGCGRTHLPGERPAHHVLIPDSIYAGEQWVNVDRVGNVGADCVFDLFAYPWPLESDSYDGALLSHLCEHIPHEIKANLLKPMGGDLTGRYKESDPRGEELSQLQDGWYAFFAELYRVLRNGAEVHILSPHARSDGAVSDPTHTRYLLPESFQHSMVPNPDAPFEYATGGIHFEMVAYTPALSSEYAHMTPQPSDPPDVAKAKHLQIDHLARSQNNVCPEFYVRLKVVK